MHSQGVPLTNPTEVEDSRANCSVFLWYAGGALNAIAVGFLAARLNSWGVAPIALMPIGVGFVVGIVLGGLAACCHVCRTRLVLGTFAIAMLTIVAEHAWLYHDFRRQWHEARAESAEVALFRPETPWSPTEYFTREASAGRIAYWAFDGLLITATAIGAALMARRSCVASDAAKC